MLKYTSPTIQNEILGIANTMVVEEFVAEANESLYLLLPMNPAIFREKNNLALS